MKKYRIISEVADGRNGEYIDSNKKLTFKHNAKEFSTEEDAEEFVEELIKDAGDNFVDGKYYDLATEKFIIPFFIEEG